MSRAQQDQVIDDDEGEACPLCIEEFDLSDRNFKPCPCGFQICQFCFNNIKNVHNGLCPGCRRPYDEKGIQWKVPSTEEVASYRENQAQQQKKKAAARQKEAQKREADTLSRKHLSGIRVRQKNLVYVTGLKPSISEEQLVQALRTDQYFGQYGKIVKIVVSKAKDTSPTSNSVGVYITYARREDAETCIQAVDGWSNGDGKLRAQYGTTKYCSSYLRNETCHNRNCMFLHEPGEENESFTRQDLSSFNVISTQSPAEGGTTSANQLSDTQNPPQQAPQLIAAASQPMDRQDSREGNLSSVDSNDGSALPTSASWGVKPIRSRRASQAASVATPSPLTTSAVPMPQVQEAQKSDEKDHEQQAAPRETQQKDSSLPSSQPQSDIKPRPLAKLDDLSSVLLDILSPEHMVFVFDESMATPEELKLWRSYPPLFDVNGGAKRQAMRIQEEERRARSNGNQVVRQALSAIDMDEAPEGGSTQLGGEPEDHHDVVFDQHQQHAIQPPAQGSISSPSFGLGHTLSPSNDLSGSALNGRAIASQAQQQFLLQQLKSASPGIQSQGQSAFGRSNQADAASSTHGRQASKFSFANDNNASASVKPVANPKLMSQQSSMMPPPHTSQFNSMSQQQNSSNQYYTSGVQGPPPGLKVTGTPPVSGGGMFGQGHGFATAGINYNVSSAGRASNDEMMRELQRNRGSSTGSGQMSDAGKREFMFPSFLQHHSNASTPSPAPGLLSFPHGPQPGAFQDQGPQKHKKKGKKHRHANTSSSGGGAVDVADPSILQARMHQAGNSGQGFYSAQGQDFAPQANPQGPFRPGEASADPTLRSPFPVPKPLQGPKLQGLSGIVSSDSSIIQSQWTPQPFQSVAGQQRNEEDIVPGLGTSSAPITPVFDRSRSIHAHQHGIASLVRSAVSSGTTIQGAPGKSVMKAMDEASFPALPKAVTPMRSKELPKTMPLPEARASEKQSKQSSSEIRDAMKNVDLTANKIPEQVKALADVGIRLHPSKLDIEAATNTVAPSSAVSERHMTPIQLVRDATDSQSSSSRPATPGTGLDTTAKKSSQPRTIRVVATPKAETPPPVTVLAQNTANATSAGTASPSTKLPSRKPSVASISIPGTPASEKVSDNASVTTDSVSRASSPQPSKVASAAARTKSKSQQKKERQEQAKTTEVKNFSQPASTVPEQAIVHEPIIGRKKKSKKPTAPATSTSTPGVSRPPSPVQKLEVAEPQPHAATPSPMAIQPKEAPEPNKSEVAPTKETSPSAAEPHKPIPFPTSIFKSLLATGEVNVEMAEFFKSANSLNHPYNIEFADLADSGTVLTDEKIELLDAGLPLRAEEESTNLRVLVTPQRTLVRGMTREMEDYFLAIEARIAATKPPLKYTHRTTTASSDENPTAKAGAKIAEQILKDKAALSRRPANSSNFVDPAKSYGDEALSYLNQFILPPLPPRGSKEDEDASTPTIGSAIPRIYTTGDPTYSVYGADVNTAPGKIDAGTGIQAEALPAVKQALANSIGLAAGGVLNLDDAEQAMLASRKECEGLEKKLLGLIRKNKRLAFGSSGP